MLGVVGGESLGIATQVDRKFEVVGENQERRSRSCVQLVWGFDDVQRRHLPGRDDGTGISGGTEAGGLDTPTALVLLWTTSFPSPGD